MPDGIAGQLTALGGQITAAGSVVSGLIIVLTMLSFFSCLNGIVQFSRILVLLDLPWIRYVYLFMTYILLMLIVIDCFSFDRIKFFVSFVCIYVMVIAFLNLAYGIYVNNKKYLRYLHTVRFIVSIKEVPQTI